MVKPKNFQEKNFTFQIQSTESKKITDLGFVTGYIKKHRENQKEKKSILPLSTKIYLSEKKFANDLNKKLV